MKHSIVLGSAVTLLAATAYAAAPAAPEMKDGLWEMVVKVDMPGMPGNMPAQTVQRCMSSKDFRDPMKTAPDSSGKASQCEIKNHRMQGNTASWDMACKGPEQMKGSGSITYQNDRYTGVNHLTMSHAGQPMQMTMNYAGRYLGPCKGQK